MERLFWMENQLHTLLAKTDSSGTTTNQQWRRRSIDSSDDDTSIPVAPNVQRPLIPEADGQIFAGETSVGHVVQATGHYDLNSAQQPHKVLTPESGQDRLLCKITDQTTNADGTDKRSLRDFLASHGMTPDEKLWRSYLTTFFSKVHILYPFLHPPSVWKIFNQLWAKPDIWISSKARFPAQTKFKLALVFYCMAIGRCTGSSRVDDSNGTEAAGWNMYSVAADLLGDHLNINNPGPQSLVGLQVLVLMVRHQYVRSHDHGANRNRWSICFALTQLNRLLRSSPWSSPRPSPLGCTARRRSQRSPSFMPKCLAGSGGPFMFSIEEWRSRLHVLL